MEVVWTGMGVVSTGLVVLRNGGTLLNVGVVSTAVVVILVVLKKGPAVRVERIEVVATSLVGTDTLVGIVTIPVDNGTLVGIVTTPVDNGTLVEVVTAPVWVVAKVVLKLRFVMSGFNVLIDVPGAI
jgi:hypothetical protein